LLRYLRSGNDRVNQLIIEVVALVVQMQRYRLSELLQAVREKEKLGYECITRIKCITKHKKRWNYSYDNEDFLDFGGVDEYRVYMVKMKK
jgi:uncharacterized Zn finger protein